MENVSQNKTALSLENNGTSARPTRNVDFVEANFTCQSQLGTMIFFLLQQNIEVLGSYRVSTGISNRCQRLFPLR
jgi:hypothetical protein